MKTHRTFCSALLALALALPALRQVQAQNELLLPFPDGSAAAGDSGNSVALRESAVPAQDEQHRRQIEIAETFIQRQQSEVSSSVPRRGEPAPRVKVRPLLASVKAPVIAAAAGYSAAPASGPQSELLPMTAETWGDPAMLPGAADDAFLPAPGDALPSSEPAEEAVPRTALGAAPAYGDLADQERHGPIFRVPGGEACNVARLRGFKFSPAGGIGARDGLRTAAAQFPHMITSEVNGPLMLQARPLPAWNMDECSNTFFMFCDAGYKAVPLKPGWRIRGITLDGPNWRWVACPRSGSSTASFSIRVYSYRGAPAASAVKLVKLTLEGPIGATDWREAFPWLNGKGPKLEAPAAPPAAVPGDAALAASRPEPELPQ